MFCLRTKLIWLLLAFSCFLPLFNYTASAQQTSLNSHQIERLVKVAELWGTVKYFHPYLAHQDIKWDSAMVSTLPDILDAKDEESYAGSIERLLSVLDDPGTYVTQSIPENTLPTDFLEPVTSWTADSILVVPLNENTLDLRDYVMVFQRLSEVLSEVQSNSSNVSRLLRSFDTSGADASCYEGIALWP